VLRLATQLRVKPVHFVSTLSVFHTPTHISGRVFTESDDLDTVGAPYGG
jgi:thioester reductase-like protein